MDESDDKKKVPKPKKTPSNSMANAETEKANKAANADKKKEKKQEDFDKVDWKDPQYDGMLVNEYATEVTSLGKGAPDNGQLKTQSWNKVHKKFGNVSGKNWPKSVLHSRISALKSQYSTMKALK